MEIDELYKVIEQIEDYISKIDLNDSDRTKLYQLVDEAKQKTVLALGVYYNLQNKLGAIESKLEDIETKIDRISKRLYYIDRAINPPRYGGGKQWKKKSGK